MRVVMKVRNMNGNLVEVPLYRGDDQLAAVQNVMDAMADRKENCVIASIEAVEVQF